MESMDSDQHLANFTSRQPIHEAAYKPQFNGNWYCCVCKSNNGGMLRNPNSANSEAIGPRCDSEMTEHEQ
ncbi:hypothetical protein J7T55_011874 [Diaporthe amygdali]|uniref:uncharacterized protein n=1 Tax=Phomopsis amygdali TaxID=1214568 RepID=UPI0022FEF83F|nr:uncharacterized protein J7T55_011874 [Diaporthe amygdali]KAJ0123409.1 hypothetical protein J7T55_011874 [Diaporthe amygdali]